MDMEGTENTEATSSKLLAMRKDYKKTSVSLAKAKAHLEFVSSCQEGKQTPKGLCIGVHCSAFMTDLTNVKENFVKTTNQAEANYVGHLKTHYDVVTDHLSEKRSQAY